MQRVSSVVRESTPPMNIPASWRIHIYQMSDATVQASVADLLARVDDLSVECTPSPDHYLIVECRDLNQARSVHRVVTLSDPRAILVHKTEGRSPVPTVTEAAL